MGASNLLGVAHHYSNKFETVEQARRHLYTYVRNLPLGDIESLLEIHFGDVADVVEQWEQETGVESRPEGQEWPSEYEVRSALWFELKAAFALLTDPDSDVPVLAMGGVKFWAMGERSWGDVSDTLDAIYLLGNFDEPFIPQRMDPNVMIEQLREWSDSIEQGTVPMESIIAGMREVANVEESKMTRTYAELENMDLKIWKPELDCDKEKYGETLVVQPVRKITMGGGVFYTVDIRTPVHMAGTEVVDVPGFELHPL